MSNMFPGSSRNENSDIKPNDAEKIDSIVASKESKFYAAKRLSKFFEIEVNLKIFGNLVWSWHFPPSE